MSNVFQFATLSTNANKIEPPKANVASETTQTIVDNDDIVQRISRIRLQQSRSSSASDLSSIISSRNDDAKSVGGRNDDIKSIGGRNDDDNKSVGGRNDDTMSAGIRDDDYNTKPAGKNGSARRTTTAYDKDSVEFNKQILKEIEAGVVPEHFLVKNQKDSKEIETSPEEYLGHRMMPLLENNPNRPTADWILGFTENNQLRRIKLERSGNNLLDRLLVELWNFWICGQFSQTVNRKMAYYRWGLKETDFQTEDPKKIESRLKVHYDLYIMQLLRLRSYFITRELILSDTQTMGQSTKSNSRAGSAKRGKSNSSSNNSRNKSNKRNNDDEEPEETLQGKVFQDTIAVRQREDKFNKIYQTIQAAHHLLCAEFELGLARNPKAVPSGSELNNSILLQPLLTSDVKLSETHKAILHLYKICAKNGYRRYKNLIYQQEITKEGIPTHFWVEYKSIEIFMREQLSKDINFESWASNTGNKMKKEILTALETDITMDFPELIHSRHHFRFTDGVFACKECKFYPDTPSTLSPSEFGTPVRLRDNISCCNKFPVPFKWDELMTSLKRAHARDTSSRKDEEIQYEKPKSKNSDSPHRERSNRSDGSGRPVAGTDNLQQQFPIENVFKKFSFGGKYQKYLKYWSSIETPLFDSILQGQGLAPDVIEVIYEQMGKMLFELKEFDNWSQILFIKGVPGSGKTTLLNILRMVYPKSLGGILSANMEERFGLAPFATRYYLICPEVKKRFGLLQQDFQMMVEGEDMSLAQKNKNPYEGPWKVPMMFAGNEVMEYVEFGSNIGRRIMVVEFLYRVLNQDLDLLKRIEMYEINKLLFKWVCAYLIKCIRCGSDSIWQHIPQYFWDTRTRLSGQTNPMILFLETAETIFVQCKPDGYKHLSPQPESSKFFIRESRFQELFQQFCQKQKINNYPKWNKDSYGDTWDEWALRPIKMKREGDKNPYMYFKGLIEISTISDDSVSSGKPPVFGDLAAGAPAPASASAPINASTSSSVNAPIDVKGINASANTSLLLPSKALTGNTTNVLLAPMSALSC